MFYPNFYSWFHRSTEKLFKANGLAFADLESEFGIVGMPLLESNAKYEHACLLGVITVKGAIGNVGTDPYKDVQVASPCVNVSYVNSGRTNGPKIRIGINR